MLKKDLGLLVLIPIFLFFLSLSTFFSFTYYFTSFFQLSSKQMEGELQPRALANLVIPIVDRELSKTATEQVDKIVNSSGSEKWLEGLDRLVKAAGNGGFDERYQAKLAAAESNRRMTRR